MRNNTRKKNSRNVSIFRKHTFLTDHLMDDIYGDRIVRNEMYRRVR